MTREDEIQLRMEVLGVDRAKAEFIVAIELGEIDGDVVVVDEDGQEMGVGRRSLDGPGTGSRPTE